MSKRNLLAAPFTEKPEEPSCVCSECGMALVFWGEFHPLDACWLYRLHRDANMVRREVGLPTAESL